jgi:hypothetical protein
MVIDVRSTATANHPVVLTVRMDPGRSRWRWLVKWRMALTHFVVLMVLWPAFLVFTSIAGFSFLFTGRYSRPVPAEPAVPALPEPAGTWTGR